MKLWQKTYLFSTLLCALILFGCMFGVTAPAISATVRSATDAALREEKAIAGALETTMDKAPEGRQLAVLKAFLEYYADTGLTFRVTEAGAEQYATVPFPVDKAPGTLGFLRQEGRLYLFISDRLPSGYDFLYLNEHKNCKLQMGGSDQWGNITTGAELIRRTSGNEVYALTCPLITKADGGKFGKTESGNVWLDPRYTSPYKFYQFWLNVSDDDAAKYIKIFTAIGREEIEALIAEHAEAPHMRSLQKRLAKEVTIMVHSEADYEAAVEASGILFGNNTHDALVKLDEDTLLAVFEGVPQFKVSREKIEAGIKAVDLFAEESAVFPSKGEMRKMAQGGGVSLNKEKLAAFDQEITTADLLNNKYLLVQRGKKNYFLLIAE